MALSKKYAGLPDLDAAPEVYETPDLADDVSTAQTGTVRTISPIPSPTSSGDEDGEERFNKQNLDRRPLDREQARRRFAGSRVDARNVDFSDNVGGVRASYRTRSSRRRRRRREGEGDAQSSDSEEEETVARKIARLRKEAEEVRLELARLEKNKDDEAEFEDSLEQQEGNLDSKPEAAQDEVEELSRILDGLSSKAGLTGKGTTEDQFLSQLSHGARQRQRPPTKDPDESSTAAKADPDSTLQAQPLPAIAAFADRLTALESALGVSSTSATSQTASILPTLARLSTQITSLHNTLDPKDPSKNGSKGPTPQSTTYNTALLDSISAKLRTLTKESHELDETRKRARETLDELREKRTGLLISASIQHSMQPRRPFTTGVNDATSPIDKSQETLAELNRPDDESQTLTSSLFLEEQSARITALYQTLPSIQRLQPLLPVVLERLRTLNILHLGAADAKSSLDQLEKRQAEMEAEIKQWREAVEGVESGIKDLEDTMKGNVKVVGDMVGNLESRVDALQKGT